MSRLLIAPAVFAILSACATQHAACPRDTTADFDVSVEQTNRPVAARPSISTAVLEKRSPYGTPSDTAYANVRYTITIVNRLNEPLHIREITLDAAGVTRLALDQCFGFKTLGAGGATTSRGFETLGAGIATTSRGFDTTIDARGSASFEMTATQMYDARDAFQEPAQVVKLQIGTGSARGKRSEELTRKVKLAKTEAAKGL